jgi:hypothetical protein
MDDFGERCDVWEETWVKARKAHRCEGCLKTIHPGEKYVRHFSLYDGMVTSEKCCEKCMVAREEFAKEPGHLLPTPSTFTESLDECISDYDSTPAEKRKWKAVLRNIERRRKTAMQAAAREVRA